MSLVEIGLFSLIFCGLTVFLGIRAINWYKYNMSMTFKKKFSLYMMIIVVIGFLVFVVLTL